MKSLDVSQSPGGSQGLCTLSPLCLGHVPLEVPPGIPVRCFCEPLGAEVVQGAVAQELLGLGAVMVQGAQSLLCVRHSSAPPEPRAEEAFAGCVSLWEQPPALGCAVWLGSPSPQPSPSPVPLAVLLFKCDHPSASHTVQRGWAGQAGVSLHSEGTRRGKE